MSAWFFVIAALMLAAALACVLVPLLRAGRRDGRPRAPFVLALLVAFALPPAALGLYALVGTPSALQTVAANSNDIDLDAATAQLRAKLKSAPDNPQGWMLLGQAYAAMNRPADARDALGYALRLAPDNPDLMIAYAEADAQTRTDHRIDGDTRKLLERAIALSPDQQRGLWLLGISDYQLGRFDGAAAHWKHLLTLLQRGSKIAGAVSTQIAMAQARAQGKTQAQAEALASTNASSDTATLSSAAPPSAPDAESKRGVALTVEVKLDPKLASQISSSDTLFVFARAIDGPPMPLAVARLPASALPVRVTLTDAMAMTPQMKLSMFPRVQISARISESGNALPQSGDLEAAPVQVATDTRKPVAVTIDRVD